MANRKLITLTLITLLASTAPACGDREEDGVRSIARQACDTMNEIAALDEDQTEEAAELIEGLEELDIRQQVEEIPIEDIEAAIDDICPQFER